jgi:hypothetical protein
MNRRYLLSAIGLLGAAILVACGSDDDDDATVAATEPPAATATATPEASSTPVRDRAAEQRESIAMILRRDFPNLDIEQRTVDLLEITPLLPPDAIPAIDAPNFDSVEVASGWLEPQEPVISFELNGDARAYPLQILTWHEIVNDVVGGEPVIVTYCPLCNSALVFSSIVDGEAREFGVSGKLRRSDLIMYDRTNESLWQQLTGDAIVGQDVGTVLTFLPAQIISFAEFEAAFPDGTVLNQETGVYRDYGMNPYLFYDRTTSTIVPVPEFDDPRLDAKERVLTVEVNGEPAAFAFKALTELVVIDAEVGGAPVVAFWQSGAVSALDDVFIIGSRNVGSAGAFVPVLDGERVTFENRDGAIVDAATGSTWNVLGQAVDGPLAGAELEPILSGSHFWFAWSVFMPETRVIVESDVLTAAAGG